MSLDAMINCFFELVSSCFYGLYFLYSCFVIIKLMFLSLIMQEQFEFREHTDNHFFVVVFF